MVIGSFVVALCLLILGWTSEIVAAFVEDAERVFGSSGVESPLTDVGERCDDSSRCVEYICR